MKAYYQWVPFMLFLQSIMFYLPHIIYKSVEGGKIKVRIREEKLRRQEAEERKQLRHAIFAVGKHWTHWNLLGKCGSLTRNVVTYVT